MPIQNISPSIKKRKYLLDKQNKLIFRLVCNLYNIINKAPVFPVCTIIASQNLFNK